MAQPQSHSQSQRSHLFILHQPIRDPDPKPLLSSSPPPTLYRECMRNHAASLGAHAVDGCGEFMPSLPSSPLSCAACGCHRNFHRRLPLPPASATHAGDSSSGDDDPGPEPPSAPHMLMALSAVAPKKRFRSKFSAEQKERMLSLSERLGWRMLRKDEGFIEDCCREIGIDKAVFKVWMHNNKHHFYGASRRASEAPPPPPLPPAAAAVGEANGSSSSS